MRYIFRESIQIIFQSYISKEFFFYKAHEKLCVHAQRSLSRSVFTYKDNFLIFMYLCILYNSYHLTPFIELCQLTFFVKIKIKKISEHVLCNREVAGALVEFHKSQFYFHLVFTFLFCSFALNFVEMFVFMNQYLSVGTLDVIGDFSV